MPLALRCVAAVPSPRQNLARAECGYRPTVVKRARGCAPKGIGRRAGAGMRLRDASGRLVAKVRMLAAARTGGRAAQRPTRPPPRGDTKFLQDGDGVEGIFEHATARHPAPVVDADGLAR
jgi:hypothetical protein